MTGSYSEILDDSHETDPECENTLICDDTCISDVQPHELGENRKETNSKLLYAKKVDGNFQKTRHLPHQEVYGLKAPKKTVSVNLFEIFHKEILSPEVWRENMGTRSSITTSLINRTLVYPALPPIDPTVIGDLEERARDVATSMDTLIENLTGTLHSISALSVECVETYRDAVCKTCDAVDSNIR
ncbi:hypothetical protein Avbf_18893 [Armadillidium vulgare]|nr:hypothetical protein Avbf_18893 [Armadillidium vulgare]